MRKSFTRLFSIFLLLLGLSFQMAYGIVFVPASSVPTDGNTNAKPTDFATKFVVAFDVVPQITDAGGTAVIYKNGGLFKTFPVTKTSTSVLVIGKTLEITHGITSFTAGDSYSVAITDGAITSLAAGALSSGVYDFVIGDYVAPVLLTTAASFTPAKGAVNVAYPIPVLVIPFDEAVNVPVANNNLAVYIYKEDGTVVDIIKVGKVGSTTLLGLGTATVGVPVAGTAILNENTNYYVAVDAGAFVDASPNKNAFGGLSNKTTWTFSTRDNSAPVISAKSVTAVANTTATLNVTLAEVGKYYYATYPAASVVTAANVVTDGTGGDSGNGRIALSSGTKTVATVGINVTASLTGLTSSSAYKTYVVTENSVGVVSATAESLAFTTLDNTAPTAVTRGTLMNAAKATNALYMVFSEQVMGTGTGTLDLRKNSDESYVKQVSASAITSRKITAAEVTANTFGAGRTTSQWVTVVDLEMTLASNVAYYVVFPAGFIKDLASNAFVGTVGTFIVPINKTDWPILSSDFEAPTVVAAFTTLTSLTSNITITFNETIQKQLSTTADWAEVVALEQNNVAVGFTILPAGAASTGVITLTPTAPYTSNTAYTVRLRNNAVMDISSNTNKITTEKVFTLTTGDLDPLTVQYGSSVGATAITNLIATSTIKIDFNKAITVNTTGTTWVAANAANAANLLPLITFKKGTTAEPFTLTYDAATFTAILTPTAALVSNAANYNLTFDQNLVKDVAGVTTPNLGGGIVPTTYSVKDYLAPVLTASHAGDVQNSGGANSTPKITFADDNLATLTNLTGTALTALSAAQIEDMVTLKEGSASGANLAFTAAYAGGGGVLTITPTVALATGKTYYYGIGASVKDATGNAAPSKFSTFTMVAPVNPPTIVATTYTVNGSAQTPVATKLVNITPTTSKVLVTVTFNDNIKEVQSVAPFNTVSLTDGVTTWTADVTPLTVSGNTLTVEFATTATLAAAFDAGNVCTLTLPAGIVQGSTAYAPATFAQFALTTILFDSKDITAPVVTDNTPVSGATGVALNTALKLTIGEKVVLGSGDILIKEGTTTVQTIPVNSTNVTLNTAGTLATVVKADLIKYNTVYTVVVPAGAFKDDISLNSNAAFTYSFTTLVNPQPVVSTFSPVDNSDLLPTAGTLTLGLTFSEEVIKYDPLVGSRKQWFLIKNTGTSTTPGTRASFDGLNDLVAGTDVVVANNYIETASVGISGVNVTIATGFTPVAGEKYYVMVTPGSFLDKSTGTTSGANVVPGVFTGITDPATWNFTTKDENPGTVTFAYTKRADNQVAKTSDIVINFTRPIKNGDGSAITDSQIATLFTLTKTAGTGTLGTKAFIGTISADKKTVTILNSSLVTLGEMTELATYTIGLTGSAIYANGTAISGASDTFTTSDYTAPAVAVSIAAPVTDIVYNTTTSQHEATITFTCTDNVNLSTVYYTIQVGDATTAAPSAAVVKADKMALVTGVGAVKTYKFAPLNEETSYVVWAVAVDAAGNESAVSKVVFITDDKTKPVIATLPSSFDAAKKLTFIFNEAVSPAASSVRILNAATMEELAVLSLFADPAATPNPKLLITDAYAGLATGNTLVNYYVEIDKGLVADVPVVATDAVNTFDGLFRTVLMVTSKDAVAPVLVSTTPTLPAVDVNANFSIKLTFDEPVKKVSTIPVDAFVVEKVLAGPLYEAYEVVDPANVVTNGTADVTINLGRALVSSTEYRLTVKLNAFEDLAGNDHATVTLSNNITAKDVLAPTVTYSPVKGATGVAVAVVPMTLTFSEAIRNLDNTAIDSYDLDSLVYFRKGTTPMAFTAALDGTKKIITITPAATLVVDAVYTYGFKAKFEDGKDNVTAADAATFSTVTTSPAALFLSWTPAKASPYAAPWPWLGTADAVKLNFTGPIFTYDAVIAANSNLPVTPAYLATAISVTKNTVAIPASDLIFSLSGNTVSVAPKAGTTWGSGSIIEVTLAANKLQINEGNVTPIPTDVSKYLAEDTIDPIVDATKTDAVFTAGYHPANVGVLGASPVIGKSDKLKLYFVEDVKVGTGTVEIYRWDGVLAKPAMMATVDAIDKKLVSLGDLSDLPTNQEYYAIVNPGAVLDVTDNNLYAGITTVKTFKFKLMDDALPQVISYLPVTSNISTATKLTISFDRPVVLGTSASGYVALYKSAAGGDAVQLWRVADNGTTAAFTISGSTATVNLSTLEANTKYYVELAAGSFASAADNTKEQLAILRSVWTFSTEVNAAPLAVTYSPAKTDPMTGDVPLNSGLTVTFDQDVVAGVGNIQLHRKQTFGGPIITNFDVADATKVTFNGNAMSIAGDVLQLQNFSEYYVIIPGTAVKNTSLTPEYFAGITVPLAWQFKTFNDITGPTAVVAPKTTGWLPADVKLTMTFNEAVVAGTGKVTLYNAANDVVVEEFTLVPAMLSGKVLTIVPTVQLTQQTSYYVKVDAGLVKDVWGNNYLGIADKTTWKFATGDFTGPTVVVTPPASPVATVFTVGLKFNEAVSGVLGGVTVTGGTLTSVDGLGDTYTLTVSAAQQKEVTIVLTDAIKDVSPNTNKFAGQTLTYTTGDFTAPQLLTWTPFDETTTNNHPIFKMTFSEDVMLGAGGSLKVYKVNTTTAVLTIPVTAAMINGKDVTVSYAATQSGLDKNARYYVLVDGTALKDKAGNAFIGVSDVASWTFKTGPVFATFTDPLNGSLEFKVYPNPFVDYVNVDNASELSKVVVTNIAGQTVKEVVNPTERIQLNELRSGIYFMSLYNSDDVIVKTAKIVKR
ncbi:MAG: hypothetical protein C0397_16670 [Odoribacter sp.]|nr:hypothetical protein [Odoribacter sp.]